eukprot:SAG31_NODE_5746_length_2348_cov_1.336739_2_plen_84_part_00
MLFLNEYPPLRPKFALHPTTRQPRLGETPPTFAWLNFNCLVDLAAKFSRRGGPILGGTKIMKRDAVVLILVCFHTVLREIPFW